MRHQFAYAEATHHPDHESGLVQKAVPFGVSAKAYLMYAFLAEHINNRTPGQRIACPKQTAIARVMGLKDDRKVAAYRRELEALGAIRVSEYRYRGGMRRGYRYVVRFNPSEAYQGLLTLGQFYDANPDVRSAPADGRTRAASGRVQRVGGPDRTTAGVQPVPVPAQRAAPGRALRTLLPDVARVIAALPRELRAAMRETARSEAPKTLVMEIERQLLGRTAEQLVERVERRWLTHRYDEKLAVGELRRPVGAAVAMVRSGACPDSRCEDGMTIDLNRSCPRCAERQEDRLLARSGEQTPSKDELREVPSWWECADCRAAGRGIAPSDGLCRHCRAARASADSGSDLFTPLHG